MAKILEHFGVIKHFLFACGMVSMVACSGPSESDLTSLAGFTEATINGPLGNSALAFTPQSFDFGTLATNAGSATKNFTVTNTSGFTVYLSADTGENSNFTLTANNCFSGLSLAPNDTCDFTLRFAPLSSGNLSTAIGLPYSTTPGTSSYSSTVSVTGSGTTLSSFAGLASITNATATSLQLNWLDVASVGAYQVYKIAGGVATLFANLPVTPTCVAGNCSYVAPGLTPTTSYTFRVRAMDNFGVIEQNIVNKTASTGIGNLTLTGSTAVGLCAPMAINSVDGSANPQNITADSTVVIGGLGSHAAIFSDSSCGTPLANPVLLNGTNTTTFYLKDSTAESLTLTGTLASFGTASYPITTFDPLATAFSMAPASGSTRTTASTIRTIWSSCIGTRST